MTYNRPGKGTHVVNTTGAALVHNQPALISNYVGVLVKQKNTHWNDGAVPDVNGNVPANLIANNEKCWIVITGIVQVDTSKTWGTALAGAAKGAPVYITAGNVLSLTAAGNTKFGRVIEVPGDGRSVPTNRIRVDLDAKDSF